MPTTYRGTFRRHRVLLSLPLVLGVLGAAAIIGTHTSSYKSTANLWVDTAPPNASSVGPGAGSLPTTPAAAEQSLLGELMTTSQFAVAVAKESLLGRTIGDAAEIDARAPSYLTPSQVGSLVGGPQVLSLSYTAASPAVARSALDALINELIRDSSGLSTAHGQALVAYYSSLNALQRGILAKATANVNAYLARHPSATAQSDPNLSALTAAENAANQQLAQTNSALSQAKGASPNASGWMVRVIDAPGAAEANVLGKKKIVEVLLGGLFGGGLITFLGILMLLPKRPKEPWEDELLGAGMNRHQRLGDPLRAELALTPGDRARDRYDPAPGPGDVEPARERRTGRTVAWRR